MARLKKAAQEPKGAMEIAYEKEKEACEALGQPFNEENFKVDLVPETAEKTPKEILTELLPIYHTQKSEMDSIKKVVDKENAEIKTLMRESNLPEFVAGDIKATCSVSERQDFIEEALIEKLKDMKVRGIIKKKEYVDMDALENAIYNGKVEAAALASCQTKKEVVTLRVSKVKK